MTNRSPTEFDKRLGQRIRQARLLKGLTQDELGQIIGVSFQQIQKYESGDNRITAERLHLISKEADVSLAFFLDCGDEHQESVDKLSDEALRLAGRIEALPDSLVRYGVSSLVSSISRAWEKRDTT
ncbi:MAG: helix-turn-helix domain-containing protein [Hyphomicrobiales bacterium]